MNDNDYIPPGRIVDWWARKISSVIITVVFVGLVISAVVWGVKSIVHALSGPPPRYAGLTRAEALNDARHALARHFRGQYDNSGYPDEAWSDTKSRAPDGRLAWDVRLYTSPGELPPVDLPQGKPDGCHDIYVWSVNGRVGTQIGPAINC